MSICFTLGVFLCIFNPSLSAFFVLLSLCQSHPANTSNSYNPCCSVVLPFGEDSVDSTHSGTPPPGCHSPTAAPDIHNQKCALTATAAAAGAVNKNTSFFSVQILDEQLKKVLPLLSTFPSFRPSLNDVVRTAPATEAVRRDSLDRVTTTLSDFSCDTMEKARYGFDGVPRHIKVVLRDDDNGSTRDSKLLPFYWINRSIDLTGRESKAEMKCGGDATDDFSKCQVRVCVCCKCVFPVQAYTACCFYILGDFLFSFAV